MPTLHIGPITQEFRDRLKVGSGPGSDLVLSNDPRVSRRHADIERVDGSWTLRNHSRNGTLVNDELVERGQSVALEEDPVVLVFGQTKALLYLDEQLVDPGPTSQTPLQETSPTTLPPATVALLPARSRRNAAGTVHVPLWRPRTLVGSAATMHLELEDDLPAHACTIWRLETGEVLVQPVRSDIRIEDRRAKADPRGTRGRRVPWNPGELLKVGNYRLRLDRPQPDEPRLIGKSPAWLAFLDEVQVLASMDVTVLLHGEMGTGKSRVARYLHDSSPRAEHPFVHVSGVSLGDDSTTIQSSLFGHVKGSFTGADTDRDGALMVAADGTLFLDEIATLSKTAQNMLLTAFPQGSGDPGTFRRFGSSEEHMSTARILAATNEDPSKLRADLRDRFQYTLLVPPLRDRRQDIPLFVEQICRSLSTGQREVVITEAATELLQNDYQGNVRELQSILLTATVHAKFQPIQPEHVHAAVARSEAKLGRAPVRSNTGPEAAPDAEARQPSASTAAVAPRQPDTAQQTPTGDVEGYPPPRLAELVERFDGKIGRAADELGRSEAELLDELSAAGWLPRKGWAPFPPTTDVLEDPARLQELLDHYGYRRLSALLGVSRGTLGRRAGRTQ